MPRRICCSAKDTPLASTRTTAWLAEGGPQALSVNAIAKELGVAVPARYRYFTSRDELLTELIVDAYHDFAAALATATKRTRGQRQRLRALVAHLAVVTWTRLHGFVSLEIEGNYAAMGLDPDLLFDAEVAAVLATAVG